MRSKILGEKLSNSISNGSSIGKNQCKKVNFIHLRSIYIFTGNLCVAHKDMNGFAKDFVWLSVDRDAFCLLFSQCKILFQFPIKFAFACLQERFITC